MKQIKTKIQDNLKISPENKREKEISNKDIFNDNLIELKEANTINQNFQKLSNMSISKNVKKSDIFDNQFRSTNVLNSIKKQAFIKPTLIPLENKILSTLVKEINKESSIYPKTLNNLFKNNIVNLKDQDNLKNYKTGFFDFSLQNNKRFTNIINPNLFDRSLRNSLSKNINSTNSIDKKNMLKELTKIKSQKVFDPLNYTEAAFEKSRNNHNMIGTELIKTRMQVYLNSLPNPDIEMLELFQSLYGSEDSVI